MARSLSIHKDGALTRSKELALSRAKAKLDRRSIRKRGRRNLCTGVYFLELYFEEYYEYVVPVSGQK